MRTPGCGYARPGRWWTCGPWVSSCPIFVPHGFLQIHREYVVNLRQIRQIRRRDDGRDWEVKLEPPVNRILPVSRGAVAKLWKTFEAD